MKMPIKLENVVTPTAIQTVLPNLTWRKPTIDNTVYITFDDGPTSNLTEDLLAVLAEHDAKATFFCLGENVEKYPRQFKAMTAAGHSIGNHSHSHLDGWRTPTSEYVDNVHQAQTALNEALGYYPKLFRPPFGHISPRQMWNLRKEFEIIMWDILSLDYHDISADEVASNVIDNTRPGSIITLHDAEVSEKRVVEAVSKIVSAFAEKGYSMRGLEDPNRPTLAPTEYLSR